HNHGATLLTLPLISVSAEACYARAATAIIRSCPSLVPAVSTCSGIRYEGKLINAIHERRSATGAPTAFVHLWVAHRGEPVPPERRNTVSMPRPIFRTAHAKSIVIATRLAQSKRTSILGTRLNLQAG